VIRYPPYSLVSYSAQQAGLIDHETESSATALPSWILLKRSFNLSLPSLVSSRDTTLPALTSEYVDITMLPQPHSVRALQ
jgi:hypothetical protein